MAEAAVWAHAWGEQRVMVSCNRAHVVALASATAVHAGLIMRCRRRTRLAEAAQLLQLIAKAGGANFEPRNTPNTRKS